jgi:hypothetical protein
LRLRFLFSNVRVDEVATQEVLDSWAKERDAAHEEIAAAAKLSVDDLRSQAEAKGLVLPKDEKPVPIVSDEWEQVGSVKADHRICARHAHLLNDPQAWHDVIRSENLKKNQAVNAIAEAVGIAHAEIAFSFDKAGQLSLEVASEVQVDVAKALVAAGPCRRDSGESLMAAVLQVAGRTSSFTVNQTRYIPVLGMLRLMSL